MSDIRKMGPGMGGDGRDLTGERAEGEEKNRITRHTKLPFSDRRGPGRRGFQGPLPATWRTLQAIGLSGKSTEISDRGSANYCPAPEALDRGGAG